MKQKARKITEADILEGAIKNFSGSKAHFHSAQGNLNLGFQNPSLTPLR